MNNKISIKSMDIDASGSSGRQKFEKSEYNLNRMQRLYRWTFPKAPEASSLPQPLAKWIAQQPKKISMYNEEMDEEEEYGFKKAYFYNNPNFYDR